MIIDSHMHIGQEELLTPDMVQFFKQKNIWDDIRQKISPEGVIANMNRCGVDQGVIFPLTFMPLNGEWQRMNDMTAKYVREYPDRLIGFAIINPKEIKDSLKELDRCKRELGFKGLKIHPSMQESFCNSEDLFSIYQFCQDENLPILFHTGASLPSHSDKFSHPVLLDDVAVRFPDLKIIIAHMGRPYYQDAAFLLRKHKNIYADICANEGRVGDTLLLENALSWIKIYADGVKRLLFSSDFPVFDPLKGLNALKTICHQKSIPNTDIPIVTETEYEAITSLNFLKIINR
jgi:uncharacterized protein